MRNEKTIKRARTYRKEQTGYETRLWSYLRDRRTDAKFRRQHAIGPYVVDFACAEARLIVELDGASHDSDEQRAFDAKRSADLESWGWRVLRVPNDRVMINIEMVGRDIREALEAQREKLAQR